MPKPIEQPPTTIKVLSGFLVLCGRKEVEMDEPFKIFSGVPAGSVGVLLSAAGARTEPYQYCSESSSFSKHNVPVCFVGRERNRSWGAAQVAVSTALKSGGTVVPLL